MSWPAVSVYADRELAHYVLDELAPSVELPFNRQDRLAAGDGVRDVARALYEALAARGIAYAVEPYEADRRLQQVRPPEVILGGAREGTCLDLALLYAGLALGKGLTPLVVALEGHALVALSLDYQRDRADHPARRQEGEWVDAGVLKDGETLRRLVDEGHYLAIECTGFARSRVLAASSPEGAGRVDGLLSFDAALAAGRAQLDQAARPFRFAIDCALLRDVQAVAAYEPPLAGLTTPYRYRLDRLIARHALFGGRDEELGWLDAAVTGAPGGYVLVTGGSGSGKTALLVNWVGRLLARPAPAAGEPEWRAAYVFINHQAELDDEPVVLQLLCQQLLRVHGRHEQAPPDLPSLQQRCAELIATPPPGRCRVVVVVDGLDEAEARGWSPKYLLPRAVDDRLHIVLSARSVADRDWVEWLDLAGVQVVQRSLGWLATEGVEALLREAPGALGDCAKDGGFVQALADVSEGDPLYLSLLLHDLLAAQAAGRPPTVAAVELQPRGLDAYLKAWWTDLAGQGKAEPAVRDLLRYLLLARGALPRDVLIDIDAADQVDGFSVDDAVARIRRYVAGDETSGFRLEHPRLAHYLRERFRPAELVGVAEALAKWCEASWRDTRLPYAAQHVIGQLRELRNHQGAGERPATTERMLRMARDRDFRDLRLDAPQGLLHDRSDVADLIAAALDDPMPQKLPALVEAAFASHDLAQTIGERVRRVFARAASGNLDGAAVLLPGVAPDAQWQAAMLLVAAGLASLAGVADAVAFRRSIAERLPRETFDATLRLLDSRIDACLAREAPKAWSLPYAAGGELPLDAVNAEVARAIVQRMGGGADAEYLAASLDPSMIGPMRDGVGADAVPMFLAERDSPWLVANAVRAAGAGWGMGHAEAADLIARYIGAHAANPYLEYRLRSLWGVLGAVLTQPDPRAAIDAARLACEAAAQGSSVEYRERLRLAGLGLAARLGDAAAAATLHDAAQAALDAAQALRAERGAADTWGAHARRLAALAEVLAVALGDASGLVAKLLEAVRALPFGYAGFQAPASLAVADALHLCGSDGDAVQRALDAARRAAHNVQECRFCALTTARVQTLATRWRPGSVADVAGVVERFARDPGAAAFLPRHRSGETFPERANHSNMLPIPDAVSRAVTVEAIALDVFLLRPPVLLRLNPGCGAGDAPAELAIPDRAFGALLAARLSAEVLAQREALGARAAPLIAALVPAAVTDATALDLVLSRLALASRPDDLAWVHSVVDAAPADWMRAPIPLRNVEA